MLIQRLKRMRDNGVFRDFDWPPDLPSFDRYNLIYGWNGSGKTTISRVFRCLQDGNVPDGSLTITINDQDFTGIQFSTRPVPVRVFNRTFIENNVVAATQHGGQPIAPIYILGEKNVEKERELASVRTTLQDCTNSLISETAKKTDADRALDNFYIQKAKAVKEALTATSSPFNNYNRSNFSAKITAMAAKGDAASAILDDSTLEKCKKKHLGSPRPQLSPLSFTFPDFPLVRTEISELIAKTIIASEVIESLRQDTDLATWVRDGLEKHERRSATACLFCGQLLPSERVTKLNAHFNDAYKTFLAAIDTKMSAISALRATLADLLWPRPGELYEHLTADYERAAVDLKSELEKAEAAIDSLLDALRAKRDAPFEVQHLSQSAPAIDAKVVRRLADLIDAHNKSSADYAAEVKAARVRLEDHYVASALSEYQRLSLAASECGRQVTDLMRRKSECEKRIKELEKEIVEHRRPAEELNHDLRSYLGHGDFQLAVKETGYEITRNGQVATRLSEGETTAIALLYFLRTLGDRGFDLSKGIVVLDDPVSSLDSNALFSAFGFIKERTKNARQIFVLTHNFTFFAQVRNWFHKLRGQEKKRARFYMLECSGSEGQRSSVIRQLDRLLAEYESEYHYLFSCVYELANKRPGQLEQYHRVPNIARRLLESFLAFRIPKRSKLWDRLEAVTFDEHKKLRILRFLHTYSHSEVIGGDQQDFSGLNETPAVLRDLLDMMRQVDPAHYQGMVDLVASEAGASDSESKAIGMPVATDAPVGRHPLPSVSLSTAAPASPPSAHNAGTSVPAG